MQHQTVELGSINAVVYSCMCLYPSSNFDISFLNDFLLGITEKVALLCHHNL